MTTLDLVVDDTEESGDETIHFEGEINPKKTTEKAKIKSKDKVIEEITIPRPARFSSKTAKALNPRGLDLVEEELDRRHVISSEDMATHYESTLKGKKWSEAKELLDPKLSINKLEAVEPLTDKIILARAKALHKAFFNDLSNLFLDDSSENRSIGQAIDPNKPGMGAVGLKNHISEMKRKYAIGRLILTE